jgi:saccharopine dehydrogenase-like NADP-dependent oxidoreductase
MKAAVIGAGAVGARLARQLLSSETVDSLVIRDERTSRLDAVVRSMGTSAEADGLAYIDPVDAEVVVLAGPMGSHVEQARAFLAQDRHVVSVSDDVAEVRALLDLDIEARERGVHVVVGAGFCPGLTCVLAAHAASRFDVVDEVHVAKAGTGGPACARQHHRALGRRAIDWREGGWIQRPPGSGRELCWFPDPIGAQDCYRAALPDSRLLVPAFPGVRRVTSRMAATRRDRFTAGMPMLWPTHPEGGPGAVRVEVRGSRDRTRDVVVFGAIDRPAVAAGAVGAIAAIWAVDRRLRRVGAGGLAELAEPGPFLGELARRGVRTAVFQGDAAPVA